MNDPVRLRLIQRGKQLLRVFHHPQPETQSWSADEESDGSRRYRADRGFISWWRVGFTANKVVPRKASFVL